MSDNFNLLELQNLELKIGYSFEDLSYLKRALTHRSYSSEHNERLEYLGDSILGMIIAKALFDLFPKSPEGDLTRMRSALVRETTLAEIAREFGIQHCLRVGPGELKTGGFRRDSLIADAVESIIGAIFIDNHEDFPSVRQVVLNWFESRLASINPKVSFKDPKSTLQEYLQGRHLPLAEYKVDEILGAENDKTFVVSATVQGVPVQVGRGGSKRKAEQEAAALILKYFEDKNNKAKKK